MEIEGLIEVLHELIKTMQKEKIWIMKKFLIELFQWEQKDMCYCQPRNNKDFTTNLLLQMGHSGYSNYWHRKILLGHIDQLLSGIRILTLT